MVYIPWKSIANFWRQIYPDQQGRNFKKKVVRKNCILKLLKGKTRLNHVKNSEARWFRWKTGKVEKPYSKLEPKSWRNSLFNTRKNTNYNEQLYKTYNFKQGGGKYSEGETSAAFVLSDTEGQEPVTVNNRKRKRVKAKKKSNALSKPLDAIDCYAVASITLRIVEIFTCLYSYGPYGQIFFGKIERYVLLL